MNRKQKPALIVATFLVGLILLPLLLLIVSKLGGDDRRALEGGGNSGTALGRDAVVDYELQQLADRAEQLLEADLADAVKSGDLDLELIGELTKHFNRAQSDQRSGKMLKAKERFEGFIKLVESRLEVVELANRARDLKNSTYTEMQRLGDLRTVFENTFSEAVATYDSASAKLEARELNESIEGFELVQAILGGLEARAIQRAATLLEKADVALARFDHETAEEAYEAVLEIDPENMEAASGLEMVQALEGIADEIREIQKLENAGEYADALARLDLLAGSNPENRFIEKLREAMQEGRREQRFAELVEGSVRLKESGDLAGAIAAVEEALGLLGDPEQEVRLAELKERAKAIRLEELLAGGFAGLENGRYESARDIYEEAVALAPESSEARTGLEKASSLFLSSVRYTQNIRGVERRIAEGRYPLAAKLFNEALLSRPAKLSPEALEKEEAIRSQLEAQSRKVIVNVTSDKRTHVSIIGVLPPERFKTMDLNLFPDVYKVRGRRQGYRPLEIDLKVDALKSGQKIHIQCTERI